MRAGALALWTLSLALGSLGVAGDVLGWWERLPFTINLVSSATGASFGAPIAVLVIDTLIKQRTTELENLAARRLAHRALRQMAHALSAVVPDRGDLSSESVLGDFFRLREQVSECRTLGQLDDPEASQELIQDICAALARAVPSADRIGELIVAAQLSWELLIANQGATDKQEPLVPDEALSKVGLVLKELGRLDIRLLDANELVLALEPIVRMDVHPEVHPSAVEARYMIRYLDDVDLAIRLLQRTLDTATSLRFAVPFLESQPSAADPRRVDG